MHRWRMRPICAQKSLGQWKQGMVAAVAVVTEPFLNFLRSLFAMFLLASQNFAQHLTTSHHLSLSCARYSTVVYWPPIPPNMPFQRQRKCIFHWRGRAWLTIWDRVKIPRYSHRLMHRKRVTCELHDSYFRSMTIKTCHSKDGRSDTFRWPVMGRYWVDDWTII